MSLGQQISEAIDKLVKNPPNNGIFTEIDVLARIASNDWDEDDLKKATRQVNEVLGRRYRARKLCRFGPVELPDEKKDYGRIATKIAYAEPDSGPRIWDTPNGTFPRMMIEDDTLGSQGRRYGTNRNDLAPWDDQQIDRQRRSLPDPTVQRLQAQVRELESALEDARSNGKKPKWAKDLERRITLLETIVAGAKESYASRR